MGLFNNLFKQEEPVKEEVQEEKKLEISPKTRELINEGKWDEIFKHEIYSGDYSPFSALDVKEILYKEFCANYPNVKESASNILGRVCDGIEGWYEVPIEKYIDANGNFNEEFYDKTAELHAYNPMLNLLKDAKNVKFAYEHILCLNNMWADGEIDIKDFFVQVNDWLDDSSLFKENTTDEDTRKLILLKKYEGGEQNA
ncbi:MAG: hypothetical protein Q4E33_05540 [Erysipelotrichaceae bacterium]|nr:hypothetical protein [Erysipelotrichaceae bacterium]